MALTLLMNGYHTPKTRIVIARIDPSILRYDLFPLRGVPVEEGHREN